MKNKRITVIKIAKVVRILWPRVSTIMITSSLMPVGELLVRTH